MNETDSPQLPRGEMALHRGWYSRGYLPHRDHPGLLQFITYRLADSLPAEVLRRIETNLSKTPTDQIETRRRKQLERWLDAGYGSCVLRRPEAARTVVDGWMHFATERYDLIAWVVMPNHVHVLIRTYDGVNLDKVIQSWKSYTARRINLLDYPKPSDTTDGIWMRDFWDRYIRDEQHFRDAVAYIHRNPVKAKLTRRAEDWPWSSAKGYIAEH